MFKDLMKSMFKEDVDIEEELEDDEEYPVDEVSVQAPEKKEPDIKADAAQSPAADAEKQPEIVNFDEIPPVQPFQPEQPKKETGFMDIHADGYRPHNRRRNSEYHFDRNKLKNNSRTRSNYQAIISPIFGNTHDEDKDYSKVHDAIRLEKPLNDPNFKEVLSPMYGQDLPTVTKKQTVPKMDPKKEAAKKQAVELSDMLEKPEKKTDAQQGLFDGSGKKD
ncbi:hypothetical protein [Catenisphaera adipataccumulans]|uniref:Uncharacterized protein n=1 Tax=Catenisphaera adipataccumulans TaxID=700500 RepID=A0A7W8D082_9FIRM|nr:hypothetical protein [Catenisphaera adipataccumulans]MBB5183185.1 hypothetical protein [Catenisphaera adipataccumulans]